MNSAQFRSLMEPFYVKVFEGLGKQLKVEWSELFDVEKADQGRYQMLAGLYGLGLARKKAEGDTYFNDEGGETYESRFVHDVYSIGFYTTKEMVEDGQYINLGRLYAKQAARSMAETKELRHIDILNNGFISNGVQTIGGDGQTLFSTQHPLFGTSGTYSNTLATQTDLSELAIEAMREAIIQCVDDRGKVQGLKPQKLFVSTQNMPNAWRITKSEKRSGTNNNDPNVLKDAGFLPKGMMELTRLTNPRAWFITTDAEDGLKHYWKRKLNKGMEGDFATGNMRFKTDERYSCGWHNPRGIFGSTGG